MTATYDGTNVTFQAAISENPAGVQEAWITYTGTSAHDNDWTSVDLDPGSGDPWHLAGNPAPVVWRRSRLRFMAQAANGVGLVGRDDNLGSLYGVSDASTSQLAAVATTLTLASGNPASGAFGSTATFSATLKAGATALANRKVTFTLGAASLDDTTDSNGVASATFSLLAVPDGYTLAAGFLGDASDLGSGDSDAFTITKGATTPDPQRAGRRRPERHDSGVTATLTCHGAPMPFKTVFFVLSGAARDVRGDHRHGWQGHRSASFRRMAASTRSRPASISQAAAPSPAARRRAPRTPTTRPRVTPGPSRTDAEPDDHVRRAPRAAYSEARLPGQRDGSSGLAGDHHRVRDLHHRRRPRPPDGSRLVHDHGQPGRQHRLQRGSAGQPDIHHRQPGADGHERRARVDRPWCGELPRHHRGHGLRVRRDRHGLRHRRHGELDDLRRPDPPDRGHVRHDQRLADEPGRTVTNPGTATAGTCTGCLGINQGPYGIAAVPFSMGRGAVSENVTFVGFNFVSGTWTPASIQFSGTGITVNSVTRVSSVQLTVNLSVDPGRGDRAPAASWSSTLTAGDRRPSRRSPSTPPRRSPR